MTNYLGYLNTKPFFIISLDIPRCKNLGSQHGGVVICRLDHCALRWYTIYRTSSSSVQNICSTIRTMPCQGPASKSLQRTYRYMILQAHEFRRAFGNLAIAIVLYRDVHRGLELVRLTSTSSCQYIVSCGETPGASPGRWNMEPNLSNRAWLLAYRLLKNPRELGK